MRKKEKKIGPPKWDRFMNPEGGRKRGSQTHKSKKKYTRKIKHKKN